MTRSQSSTGTSSSRPHESMPAAVNTPFSFELGTLVALALYVQRIYQPLTALTSARVDYMTAVVSFERVFEVLDAPRSIDDRPGAYDLVAQGGKIEADDVSCTNRPVAPRRLR